MAGLMGVPRVRQALIALRPADRGGFVAYARYCLRFQRDDLTAEVIVRHATLFAVLIFEVVCPHAERRRALLPLRLARFSRPSSLLGYVYRSGLSHRVGFYNTYIFSGFLVTTDNFWSSLLQRSVSL